MFTFVIPACNEQDNVATIVRQACQAAQRGDRVLVVDSASTDATGQRAAAAGAEVLRGPPGKGAADLDSTPNGRRCSTSSMAVDGASSRSTLISMEVKPKTPLVC